jgi:hypothetical protein
MATAQECYQEVQASLTPIPTTQQTHSHPRLAIANDCSPCDGLARARPRTSEEIDSAGSLVLVSVKGRGWGAGGAMLKKADETETWVRDLTVLAVDGGARARREQYHAGRAAIRLEGEVSGLRRRVAELEDELGVSENHVVDLRAECAGLHKDMERREMNENDLWRLVREMERAVKGGKDFDGVVAALLNESRTVYRTAMQRWHSERDTILAQKATSNRF